MCYACIVSGKHSVQLCKKPDGERWYKRHMCQRVYGCLSVRLFEWDMVCCALQYMYERILCGCNDRALYIACCGQWGYAEWCMRERLSGLLCVSLRQRLLVGVVEHMRRCYLCRYDNIKLHAECRASRRYAGNLCQRL